MSRIAIASLIAADESINPLLEILWEIEQQEQQGHQLIELVDEIGLEDFTEAMNISKQASLSMHRSLDHLKRASPIAAPMTIRGF
jgi:dissimilatory sulfite reductase (desulfoviridin) alpha/beta subunit